MLIKAFHISPKKNRASILNKGILPNQKTDGRIQYGPRIFISTNKNDLAFDYVNYENVDCWEFEVDSNLIKKDEFSGSTDHFYIENKINPDSIKLLESY
jgi:hypothetical protein